MFSLVIRKHTPEYDIFEALRSGNFASVSVFLFEKIRLPKYSRKLVNLKTFYYLTVSGRQKKTGKLNYLEVRKGRLRPLIIYISIRLCLLGKNALWQPKRSY
jgi:hypothetical protein